MKHSRLAVLAVVLSLGICSGANATYVGNDPANKVDPSGDITITNSCSSGNSTCGATTRVLKARNDAVTPKINALHDDQQIQMRDGSTMSGVQLKTIWNNTTLNLTDTQSDFGNGGAGANQISRDTSGNFKSALVNMNAAQAWSYAAHGMSAQNFLLFHETGHGTPSGLKATDDSWKHFGRGLVPGKTWGPSDPDWQRNETTANDAARAISGTVGEPISNPTSTTFTPEQ